MANNLYNMQAAPIIDSADRLLVLLQLQRESIQRIMNILEPSIKEDDDPTDYLHTIARR